GNAAAASPAARAASKPAKLERDALRSAAATGFARCASRYARRCSAPSSHSSPETTSGLSRSESATSVRPALLAEADEAHQLRAASAQQSTQNHTCVTRRMPLRTDTSSDR